MRARRAKIAATRSREEGWAWHRSAAFGVIAVGPLATSSHRHHWTPSAPPPSHRGIRGARALGAIGLFGVGRGGA
eukprot:9498027-Pyramimonas_sp.AAC.1